MDNNYNVNRTIAAWSIIVVSLVGTLALGYRGVEFILITLAFIFILINIWVWLAPPKMRNNSPVRITKRVIKVGGKTAEELTDDDALLMLGLLWDRYRDDGETVKLLIDAHHRIANQILMNHLTDKE